MKRMFRTARVKAIPRRNTIGLNANKSLISSSNEDILNEPTLVIGRQLEMMNVIVGFEQQNKYSIRNEQGNQIGTIYEEGDSFLHVVKRQLLRTRREFKADVVDIHGNVVFKVYRPIKWFLNSEMMVMSPKNEELGLIISDWHLWRRRYNLFHKNVQIGRIDEPFLSWDFEVLNESGNSIGSVGRNFIGLIKELFTDMGQYVVRPSSRSREHRACIIAAAISIDIDYFSRHSNHSTGFFYTSGSGSGE
jgi:hypothetical protein